MSEWIQPPSSPPPPRPLQPLPSPQPIDPWWNAEVGDVKTGSGGQESESCFSADFPLLFRCYVLAIVVRCSSLSLSLSSPVTALFFFSLLPIFHFVQKFYVIRFMDGRTNRPTNKRTEGQVCSLYFLDPSVRARLPFHLCAFI